MIEKSSAVPVSEYPERIKLGLVNTISWPREFLGWGTQYVGSTRSSALIRIGLVFIIWTRFAYEQLPYRYEFGWQTLFSLAFYISTLLMLIGYKSQISTFCAGVLTFSFYYYFGLVLDVEPYTHHHTYWLGMATILCSLTPCGKSYSLDRWMAIKSARESSQPIPDEYGNLWGLRLMVVQLTMMYFWSAYDKTHVGFLGGDRLEAIFMKYYIGSTFYQWEEWEWVFSFAAWLVVLLEYALALFMPFKRTRKYFVLPGIALHLCFYVTLPVFTYSITVLLLYLSYFDAGQIHELIDEVSGYSSDNSVQVKAGNGPGQ